jgi:hypothetical protein
MHDILYYVLLLLVVSPEDTAVKKLLSGEQLHHEVCSTAYRSVQSYRLATCIVTREL